MRYAGAVVSGCMAVGAMAGAVYFDMLAAAAPAGLAGLMYAAGYYGCVVGVILNAHLAAEEIRDVRAGRV